MFINDLFLIFYYGLFLQQGWYTRRTSVLSWSLDVGELALTGSLDAAIKFALAKTLLSHLFGFLDEPIT